MRKMIHKMLVALITITIFFFNVYAKADEYNSAEYSNDGSSVFWFIQISDTHIDNFLGSSEEENLTWVLIDGVSIIQPYFIVNTGDLTDSTNGYIYGTGPHQSEWDLYRSITDTAGMTPDFYYDLPGNHDAYGDGNLQYYLNNSVWGTARHTTQPYWRIDLPFGSYLFASAATPPNDGKQWPSDNSVLTDQELSEIANIVSENDDVDFSMFFGHHDYATVENGGKLVASMLAVSGFYYSHGHEHDFGARLSSDGVIRWRIDSLGQSKDNNVVLWAVDSNTLSMQPFSAGSVLPALVITAPGPSVIDTNDGEMKNPYAPAVPQSCKSAPVRALVFDKSAITSVAFRIDEGSWVEMAKRTYIPQQWRGVFDATSLPIGNHKLEVRVKGSAEQTRGIKFEVMQGTCSLGEEDPDLPPDDGGTQEDSGAQEDAGLEDSGGAQDDSGIAADTGGDDTGVELDGGTEDQGVEGDIGSDAGSVEDTSGSDSEATEDSVGGETTEDSGTNADEPDGSNEADNGAKEESDISGSSHIGAQGTIKTGDEEADLTDEDGGCACRIASLR